MTWGITALGKGEGEGEERSDEQMVVSYCSV